MARETVNWRKETASTRSQALDNARNLQTTLSALANQFREGDSRHWELKVLSEKVEEVRKSLLRLNIPEM